MTAAQKENREETIAEVLILIAGIDNIQDMRDKILRLARKMKGKEIFLPLIIKKLSNGAEDGN